MLVEHPETAMVGNATHQEDILGYDLAPFDSAKAERSTFRALSFVALWAVAIGAHAQGKSTDEFDESKMVFKSNFR